MSEVDSLHYLEVKVSQLKQKIWELEKRLATMESLVGQREKLERDLSYTEDLARRLRLVLMRLCFEYPGLAQLLGITVPEGVTRLATPPYYGLGGFRLAVLETLKDGPKTTIELISGLGRAYSQVWNTCKQMESEGLLQSKLVRSDRMRRLWELTEEGRRELVKLQRIREGVGR